jgi:hypothetical protein
METLAERIAGGHALEAAETETLAAALAAALGEVRCPTSS